MVVVSTNVCREVVIPECKQNMMSLRGQAGWAKMTSLGEQHWHATQPTKLSNKPFSLQTLVSTHFRN